MNKAALLTKVAQALAAEKSRARQRAGQAKAEPAAPAAAPFTVADVVREVRVAAEISKQVLLAEDLVRAVVADMRDELRGADGRNVERAEAEAIVRQVFAEMAPGLRGKDGKTVKPEAVLAMVREVFAEHRAELKGAPGKDVDLAQVSAMVGQALADIGHEKPTAEAIQAAIKAEVQTMAPALRGEDGRPGLAWKGEWQRRETYQPGDVVRRRNAAYTALREVTGVEPGTDARYWDLLVRDGLDGGGFAGGFDSSPPTPPQPSKVWVLADTAWPHYGYVDGSDWKIERVNTNGTTSTARPADNTGKTYAQAWASRETLNYQP